MPKKIWAFAICPELTLLASVYTCSGIFKHHFHYHGGQSIVNAVISVNLNEMLN